jgi:hypothetical protein
MYDNCVQRSGPVRAAEYCSASIETVLARPLDGVSLIIPVAANNISTNVAARRTSMRHLIWMVTLVTVLTLGTIPRLVWAQDADPLDGTWTLNVSKSKFNAGPTIKSQTRKYEVSGDTVKQTLDGVDASGKPVHMTFNAHYDGKDYPVGGNPDADTIAVRRTDKYSAKSTQKKDGKTTLTTERHVSKDGKTLTMKTTGTNSKGEKVDNVLVFDKQ